MSGEMKLCGSDPFHLPANNLIQAKYIFMSVYRQSSYVGKGWIYYISQVSSFKDTCFLAQYYITGRCASVGLLKLINAIWDLDWKVSEPRKENDNLAYRSKRMRGTCSTLYPSVDVTLESVPSDRTSFLLNASVGRSCFLYPCFSLLMPRYGYHWNWTRPCVQDASEYPREPPSGFPRHDI